MSRTRKLLVSIAIAALTIGFAAACVESDPEAAETPADASTITNSAPQTDADGNTVPAPGNEGEPGGGDGDGGEVDPVVAAGETVFSGSCQGCHADGGRQAGVGPQLAEAGLDGETIRSTVTNGRGSMPGGLASGEDLDNVVAYVLSLQ